MDLKLITLELENFKGVKKFRLETGGDSAIIVGKNGVGKTTLADAFYWLLTDESGDGSSSFSIHTNGPHGEPKANAVVSASLQINSKNITLKKEYAQKWTKKRGSARAEFTGNRTNHEFDGVPSSKKIYDQKLAEIIDVKLIRTLSDVHHFCGRAKPDYRREMLLKLAGDITDTDIIADDKSLSEIPDILGNNSVDDTKTILASAKRACNRQLDEIPSRIDEKKRGLPDVENLNEESIRAEIAQAEEQYSAKKNQIAALINSDGEAERQKDIALLESKLIYLENEVKRESQKEIDALVLNLSTKKMMLENDKTRLTDLLKKHPISKRSIEQKEALKQDLIKTWQQTKSKKYIKQDTCITCGQDIPDDFTSNQEEAFNNKRSEELKLLDQEGIAITRQIKEAQAYHLTLVKEIEKLELEISLQEEELKKTNKELHKLNNKLQSNIGIKTQEIISKINDLQSKKIDLSPQIEVIEKEVFELDGVIAGLKSKLLDIAQVEKSYDRIKELETGLKDAAIEFETIERKLFLLEEFVKKRAEYIQANVSRHFEITKWELFKYQINDGVKPICEATRDGVNYSQDLNTGGKINVGLDCIKALSKHFDISVPVFVDNAESVTEWIETDNMQLIKLMAKANVDKLEITSV